MPRTLSTSFPIQYKCCRISPSFVFRKNLWADICSDGDIRENALNAVTDCQNQTFGIINASKRLLVTHSGTNKDLYQFERRELCSKYGEHNVLLILPEDINYAQCTLLITRAFNDRKVVLHVNNDMMGEMKISDLLLNKDYAQMSNGTDLNEMITNTTIIFNTITVIQRMLITKEDPARLSSMYRHIRIRRSDNVPTASLNAKVEVTGYKDVQSKLETFVTYFVKEFESHLFAYHKILEGETKKAGKFSDTFSQYLGQGLGAAGGALLGSFLWSPIAGAKAGAMAGKPAMEKLGNRLGGKDHKAEAAKLLEIITYSQKSKDEFRAILVKNGVDIFRSLEMQFVRVTSKSGPNGPLQLLARDAVNRAINYLKTHKDGSIGTGVILGESKREEVYSISAGYEVSYEYKSTKKVWNTASVYSKTGVAIENKPSFKYYKNKVGSGDTAKYGYRRLLSEEKWAKLKDNFIQDDITVSHSGQFTDYIYVIEKKDLNNLSSTILKKINNLDTKLEENRLKSLLEEVKSDLLEDLNLLKKQTRGFVEDRDLLIRLEKHIKSLNIEEYLHQFDEYFKTAAEERTKITKIVETGREENEANFNIVKVQMNEHHVHNIEEHRKTQDTIEDNSKKIDFVINMLNTKVNEQNKDAIDFDIKDPVQLFTGRQDELKELHSTIQRKSSENTLTSRITTISGLGGIGKTQLARRYIQMNRIQYGNNVIWINAESESELSASLRRLAKDKLNIVTQDSNGKDKDIRTVVADIYTYFENKKSLFVFDNIENVDYIKKFLPMQETSKAPHMLFTTRYQKWEKGIKTINLNKLKLEDAIEFVKKGLSAGDEDLLHEDVCLLVEKLQQFPLAIQQAISYIEFQSEFKEFGIRDYIADYDKITKKLLDFKEFSGIDNDYVRTTFTTWFITMETIAKDLQSGKLASDVIKIMAYIEPDNINKSIFLQLAANEVELNIAIRLLVNYSMISGENKNSELGIHRLVQEVIRLENKGIEEQILKKALELLNSDPNAINTTIGQITKLWSYVSGHEKLVDDFYFKSLYRHCETPLHLLIKADDFRAIKSLVSHLKNKHYGKLREIMNAEGRSKDTPLLIAVEVGNMDVVRFLVDNGADMNKVTYLERPEVNDMGSFTAIRFHKIRPPTKTPVTTAALHNNWAVVRFLLGSGVNVADCKDSVGRSLLHIAAEVNDEFDIMEYLISKDVNVNAIDNNGCIPLHYAAASGQLNNLKLLAENGSDLNIKSRYGKDTPLHLGARQGQFPVVEYLISTGADLEIRNSNQWTALHYAAESGNLDIVKILVNKGAKIDAVGYDEITPLLCAVSKGNTDVVRFLLENGAQTDKPIIQSRILLSAVNSGSLDVINTVRTKCPDLNIADKERRSLLHFAAQSGKVEIVRFLIKNQMEVDSRDDQEFTPLHNAAAFGRLEAVKLLLANGANVNACTKVKNTPLHLSSRNGHMAIVEFLIDNGGKMNAVNSDELTPLQRAVAEQQWDVAKYLIDKGADINIYHENEETILHKVAGNGNLDILKLIISKGSKTINAVDVQGRTALHFAAMNKHQHVIEYLIENGKATIDLPDKDGWTPLLLASKMQAWKLVKMLVGYGANFKIIDNEGSTPIHRAAEQDELDVVQFFLNRGADVNVLDKREWTPVQRAAKRDRWRVVEYLINDKKAKVNAVDKDGEALLHRAAYACSLKTIEILLSKGADINLGNKLGSPSVWKAVTSYNHNKWEVVKFLLDKGATTDYADSSGRTILHQLIIDNTEDLHFIKYLIEKNPNLLNRPDRRGFNSLHLSMSRGRLDIAEYLLNKGAELNAHNNDGNSLIYQAVREGNKEMVNFLADRGANVNALNENNWTTLHYAASKANFEMACLLIELGANIHQADAEGFTPLHIAMASIYGKKWKLAKYLVEKGADANMVLVNGQSLLHIAASCNTLSTDIVRHFIHKGADVNAVDSNGRTPLHMAVWNGRIDIVRLLVEHHSKIDAIDKNNETPLNLALREGNDNIANMLKHTTDLFLFIKDSRDIDLIKELLNNGAIVNAVSSEYNGTPLHVSSSSGNVEISKLLLSHKADPFISNANGITALDIALNVEMAHILQTQHEVPTPPGWLMECPPSGSTANFKRRKRRGFAEGCELSWENDIDRIKQGEDKTRIVNKLKIDSKKFIDYLAQTPMSQSKQAQLIQLAGEASIEGPFQASVKQLLSNKNMMNHLQKLGKASGIAMHGMMSKNVAVDLMSGNFEGAAFNLGFIAAGQHFSKLAQVVSSKGVDLAVNGKTFLGKSLRAASPFLGRVTSAFVIYDMVKQINEFNNGNNGALVGIAGDGIYLGVDTAEIAIEVAEALGAFEGVSSVSGPIGAAIGAVVFIGTDIYMAVEKVYNLDEVLTLSSHEKFIEGLRTFIGAKPEKYLINAFEEKQVNDEMVRQVLKYMNGHSDIVGYVLPTGTSVIDSCHQVSYQNRECKSGGFSWCSRMRSVTRYVENCSNKVQSFANSVVALDRKLTNFKWSRAAPSVPDGAELFCLPKGEGESIPIDGSYYCENAIGIFRTSSNKTGKHTIIDLGEGDDYATGLLESSNIFIVNNGYKRYTGGDSDDTFILCANHVKGFVDGGRGVNTLDLTNFAPNATVLDVHLELGDVIYGRHEIFRVFGIERIIARKRKSDRIFCACNVKFVDSNDGNSAMPDIIIIEDETCDYEISVMIRPYSIIINRATSGKFNYIIPFGYGNASVETTSQSLNTFIFDYQPSEILNVEVEAIDEQTLVITIHFSALAYGDFNVTIAGVSNCSLILANNSELQIAKNGNLFLLSKSSESVDQIISNYLVMSRRITQMSFFIQSNLTQETVVIGSGRHEVIHNNPLYTSHLIGNGGENVYRLEHGNDNLTVNDLPLSEVFIYDMDFENKIDIIDMRHLFNTTNALANYVIELNILENRNDLLLEAILVDNSLLKHHYFTVTVKYGIEVHKMLRVITHNVIKEFSQNIAGEWSLVQPPIIFQYDKQIIVVSSRDVDYNARLITPRKAGRYVFARNLGTNLIITNALDSDISTTDLCSITLLRFFEEPKMNTMTIQFTDNKIVLSKHLEQIQTAQDLDALAKEHYELTQSIILSKSTSVRRIRRENLGSGSNRPSSWFNKVFNWVRSGIDKFAFHKPKYLTDSQRLNYTNTFDYYKHLDTCGSILLLDVLARTIQGNKYNSVPDKSVSFLEALGYAINITESVQNCIEQIRFSNGLAVDFEIDYSRIQNMIMDKIVTGKVHEIEESIERIISQSCTYAEDNTFYVVGSHAFKEFVQNLNYEINSILT